MWINLRAIPLRRIYIMDNVILTEAFKELKLLEEESFDISSTEEIEDAKEFVADEDPEEVVEIADIYADEEDELPDSYVGKVILECNVCHSKIFEDADKVDIEETVPSLKAIKLRINK